MNTSLLVTGRSPHAIAQKRVNFYRKYLSYATTTWDLKTDELKEAGTTTDNVIEFVRIQIYKDLHDLEIDDNDSDKVDDYNKVDGRSEDNIEDEGMYDTRANEEELGDENAIDYGEDDTYITINTSPSKTSKIFNLNYYFFRDQFSIGIL